ncbi:DUF1801 domain-containing protein [Alteromonas flava]|uniref:DUF1801 domain-containing protein n=1 Tax=Alteromonas flava TaxID=2048003 RepID=UPI000C28AFC4|nr:DUF1801 domain-containing protein [Alteromonas flava]
MYSAAPTTFAEMIAPVPGNIKTTAQQLRSIINQTLPMLTETVSGGLKVANALYSFETENQVVCGLQVNQENVKLFIHQFSAVDTADFKLQGSGKHVRHIKFSDVESLNIELISRLLKNVHAACGYA